MFERGSLIGFSVFLLAVGSLVLSLGVANLSQASDHVAETTIQNVMEAEEGGER